MNSKLREILREWRRGRSRFRTRLSNNFSLWKQCFEPPPFTEDDLAAFEQSAEDLRQGRFVSDEEVREVLGRYRGK